MLSVRIETPLVPVLSRVERNGVKIDPAVLHKHSEEITLRLNWKKKAHDIAGEVFNCPRRSAVSVLFEKQGIKPLKVACGRPRQRRKRKRKSWR